MIFVLLASGFKDLTTIYCDAVNSLLPAMGGESGNVCVHTAVLKVT
jgi:hypothetical protein